ncbi:armadillo-type protein [Armillaria novae-zelandiae]|uniref:Armadillo-type protein n=1 Tax=Armillaria novae-zelandiae TaxID=153914 RepID=A0AA39U2A2_9AGAR|nr:armadillo-type protein [Armillaria novae-zelandiae]
MDSDNEAYEKAQPAKRFKYQSYSKSLKDVHLPSALEQSKRDYDFEDSESHFRDALSHWRQLNLSPSFITFANKASSLSASLPLLLHNWHEVVELWISALKSSDDEGFKALLDLLQKLTIDLRSTLSPVYTDILHELVALLPRSISAEALTILLSTFSLIFKHLLVSSMDLGLLEQTWTAVRSILPKCLPEIQRAMAEVLGALLRRLGVVARGKMAALVAADVTGIDDAAAWLFVCACKSVSQTLHTATQSILKPLLVFHLSCKIAEPTYTLLRRILTALIHHVRNSEKFSPIGDLLISIFMDFMSEAYADNTEGRRRVLEILSISCSVRQGSRHTDKHLSQLLTAANSIPITEEVRLSLLKLSAAVLTAGDMALSMGLGHRFLERSWDYPVFAMELHGTLADLGWGGWKMIALPTLLKKTHILLEKEPVRTLRLLASVHKGKRLGEVDLVWKQRVEQWVKNRLQHWVMSRESALELQLILILSGYLSAEVTPLIVSIVDSLCNADPEPDTRNDSFPSPSWVLGLCLPYLSKRPQEELTGRFQLKAWIQKCVIKWYWSPSVISGLVSLENQSGGDTADYEELYLYLQKSILSHDSQLRLNALRLLVSPAIKVPGPVLEVVKRCLRSEEVPLDIQGIRERVLRMGRVGQNVADQNGGADLCARWLVAQLKVNLRPLWSPAAGAIASLAQHFGDDVWSILFGEVQAVSQPDYWDSTAASNDDVPEGGDDIWEEERSWRDPSAHKFRLSVCQWSSSSPIPSKLSQASTACENLDIRSYEAQLVTTLGQCSSLAEKHNHDLISYFFSIIDTDSKSKTPRQKLTLWLTLFSKFINPKALYATDKLRDLYFSLLSHPDRSLQSVALSCILAYKSRSLSLYEDKLRLLLDNTRWRDELTSLSLAEIEPHNRPEIINVIVRLLFGIMLEKRGRLRGYDRRTTILGVLDGCTEKELGLLVDLMVKPFAADRHSHQVKFFTVQSTGQTMEKQQMGFLTLLGDLLKNLGPRLTSYWPALLGTTINIVSSAQTKLSCSGQAAYNSDDEVDDEEEAVDDLPAKATRAIRQLGIKRFSGFFQCPVSFNFEPYLQTSFSSFISPRVPLLDKENTQSPSALLELFSVWSKSVDHAMALVRYDTQLLPQIYNCLIATNVKPAVVSRILDIIERLLALSAEEPAILESILKPRLPLLLTNMTMLIERKKGSEDLLAERQITVLSQLAPYSTNADEAKMLLRLFTPSLRKSSKVVSEKVKTDLLNIVSHLIPLVPEIKDDSSTEYNKLYEALSQMLQTLRSRSSRLSLMAAFQSLAAGSTTLQTFVGLLQSLNSYSQKCLDEPDFDRRLKAFAELNDSVFTTLSSRDWAPFIYQSLYSIQDPDELAIRNSAAHSMRRFIECVAARSPDFVSSFSRILFPGLKYCLRSKNELVRVEALGVLAYAVTTCEDNTTVQDMRMLLANGDEEANFFNNIQHVQVHRRSRALRRLADQCDEYPPRSSTLAGILIPLISHYLVPTSPANHHLVNDAITAVGRLAKHLAWGAYYALIQSYMRLSKARDESEKTYVRTLVSLLDNFHFSIDEQASSEGTEDVEVNEDEQPDHSKPLKNNSRISDAVNNRLLPELLKFIESRDSTTEDITRIPISIGIVKVALHLPPSLGEPQITRLLTVTCQILRSKSQETRDATRDALARISVTLGPKYLPLVIQELRGALLRGPHLHILSYTAHALLVHVTSPEHASVFHTLDDCVSGVAHISAEVIFGESGKDVRSEDFKTKMREVRGSSSKGLDSFSILAKHVTSPYISGLLSPLRSIMRETESVKVMQLVDEVIKRITTSLNVNSHLIPTELLLLSHTLITQNAQFLKETPSRKKTKSNVQDDVVVQLKRQVAVENDHYGSNSYRFVVFGLELFNTALRRNRFDFRDTGIISRLESMVVAIGNTLYSTSSPVLISGVRCVAGLVKCPLKSMDKSLPVFIKQILDIVRLAGNTESELVQVALKSLATIIRDGPAVDVKEKDLVFLLDILSPDLEEPSRQTTVFTMLRAIVSRKFVVPEIYDLMEKVSETMVASQSPQVQELCRGVLLQFLLDYPQGKGRLRNQMTFLAKNLSYVHESGRKSVMELLGAVIAKFQSALVWEYADLLFVALVMVIANDDSAKCTEMAAQLIKSLLGRLDDERREVILSHLHSWASQESQVRLTQVASQVYGLFVDALQTAALSHVPAILQDVNLSLQRSAQALLLAEVDGDAMEVDLDWQTPYHSLVVISKVVRVFPNLTSEHDTASWQDIVTLLLFPHSWVRTASCRLLGSLFATNPVQAPADADAFSVFSKSGMIDVSKKLCLQLKSQHLDEPLSLQLVKNLFYIGKCFVLSSPVHEETEEDESTVNLDAIGDLEDLEETPKQDNPLPCRRNRHNQPNWHHQPLSVLRWFAAMASFLEPKRLEVFLVHILSPVYRIIEDDTIRDQQMDELKTLATELQDLVQSRVGSAAFSTIYNQIRQGVLGVRRERKAVRALQVATNPEMAYKRKVQKNIMKKDSRKRKGDMFSDRKGSSIKRHRS